jgi:hypothetical protein
MYSKFAEDKINNKNDPDCAWLRIRRELVSSDWCADSLANQRAQRNKREKSKK